MSESTMTASRDYQRVVRLPGRELERTMQRGEPPSREALAGWEFRGFNTPAFTELLRIRKFIKGFFTRDGVTYGYNVPVVQNGIGREWRALPEDERPKRFGFFLVTPPDAAGRDNAYLSSLLLDYARGENPLIEPARILRDYLVRVERGSDELLLGKAFLALGPARVATSYFVLERHRPTDYVRA